MSVQIVGLCAGYCVSLSVGRTVVVLLQIFKHSQPTTLILSTGTCAGQHYECSAEDSVEDISILVERNLHVWLIVAPAVDAAESVVVAALHIDPVSPTTGGLVAQDVGEVRLVTVDVIQEIFLLDPLHGQLDGPVLPLSVLEQIFFPVKVPIESLASCVLLSQNNQMTKVYPIPCLPCIHFEESG